jgi:hypothetical protein
MNLREPPVFIFLADVRGRFSKRHGRNLNLSFAQMRSSKPVETA